MERKNAKVFKFIEALLKLDEVKDLEFYDDQGVKVSHHTYDVLEIAVSKIVKRYKTLEQASKILDFFTINVSVIIHDISKGTIRKKEEDLSHSQMMKKNPEYIISEVFEVLARVENTTGLYLKEDVKRNIAHVVLTHHGKWGKFQPATKEAHIVHESDMESATFHRINPINANDILAKMAMGLSLDEVEVVLHCTSSVIKDRMKRSKRIVKVATNRELLEIYKEKGKVPIGDEFFVLRAEETKKLKKRMENEGFYKLMMTNPLMEFMEDGKVFKQ